MTRDLMLAVGWIALGACYSPSVEPCRYACNEGACPSGLTCNAQVMCATSAAEMCGGDGGAIDTPPDSSCGWSAVSNVDPCALRADLVTASWNIPGGETWTVDTDMLTVRRNNQTVADPVITQADQTTAVPQGSQVALIAVGNFNLGTQSTLQVIGSRPLTLLVNGTAMIAGSIEIQPTVIGAFGCPTSGSNGTSVTTLAGAGGGGGGGFGPNANMTAGGAGGTGATSPAPSSLPGGAGGLAGDVSNALDARRISPLRHGCPGGQGGTMPNPGAVGGRPGAGGGALQISARTSLGIAGMINAPGAGGATGSSGGGGGGGAGGAILLEAERVDLAMGARLCANGGGGASGMVIATGQGQLGQCTVMAALGGGETPNGTASASSGGAGATAMLDAERGSLGKQGTDTANPSSSGGGGGGGVGRIRINGQLIVTPPVLSTPMYTAP